MSERPEIELNFAGLRRQDSEISLDYHGVDSIYIHIGSSLLLALNDEQFGRLFQLILPFFSKNHDGTSATFDKVVRVAICEECNQRKNSDLRADDFGVRRAIAKAVAATVQPVFFGDNEHGEDRLRD